MAPSTETERPTSCGLPTRRSIRPKFAGGSRCEVASEDDLARLRLLLARSAAEPIRQSAAA